MDRWKNGWTDGGTYGQRGASKALFHISMFWLAGDDPTVMDESKDGQTDGHTVRVDFKLFCLFLGKGGGGAIIITINHDP